MVYKFCIVSDEVENFKLEILIDSEDTFLRLRNTILESVGYTKDQIESFFICSEDWEKEKEVTLIEMDTDSDEDVWLMDDTPLSELIEDEGQRLVFMYDYITERCFYMEMKEIITGKNLRDPLCQRKEGKAPKQLIDINELNSRNDAQSATTGGDLDEDFYGDDGFNDDELTSLESLEGEM